MTLFSRNMMLFVGVLSSVLFFGGAFSKAEVMYILPDTGQTTCYNDTAEMTCPQPGEDFYGQDANYIGVQPSYADGGDGTVADMVTGLVWQKLDDGVLRTWTEAETYCLDLSLGERTDWRLPSRKELLSIVDAGRRYPALNPVFECSSAISEYWTGTSYAGDIDKRWYVFAYLGNSNPAPASESYRVRCVNGPALPDSAYTDNDNGTITDHTTRLMWEKAVSPGSMTWKQALAWCENRVTAGKTDWRLPNKRELEALVDDSRYNPAMNPAFGVASRYWASTTYMVETTGAWYVDATYGYSFADAKSYETVTQYARCVRNAENTPGSPNPAPGMLLLGQ